MGALKISYCYQCLMFEAKYLPGVGFKGHCNRWKRSVKWNRLRCDDHQQKQPTGLKNEVTK